MAAPWLSVLIPVYNVEAYLQECVQSVVGQLAGAGEVEVILYNDASTDGSWALMQALARQHPGLRLLDGDRNRGLSAARNRLLEASQGEWVWFLDSDDFLLPGALSGLRERVERHRIDLVLCDFQDYRDPPKLRHRLRGMPVLRTHDMAPEQPCSDASRILEGLFLQSQLHAWSKIGRRALYGADLRFPEGRYFEDIYVTPSLALRAGSVLYTRQAWVAYRKRPGSILSTPNPKKGQDMQDSLNHLPALLAGHRPALSEAALLAATYFAYRTWMRASEDARRQGDWDTVRRFLAQCEASAPRSLPALQAYCRRRGWWWRSYRIAAQVREAKAHAA